MPVWLNYCVICFCCLCSTVSFAASKKPVHLDVKEASVANFIDNMELQHGFDRANLMQLLSKATIRPNILKLMGPPPSKTVKRSGWYKYRDRFITDVHTDRGSAFWQRNAQNLARAEQTYGVPAAVIIGILGVETIYGREMGSFLVLDALATLGFYHPRRAEFFKQELEAFLLLCQEEGLDPLSVRGSYAGAMGWAQFMPSSFRKYAIDFDNDGHRDIWNNEVDAIGSIANYLREYGWQAGQPVIEPVNISSIEAEPLLNEKFEPTASLAELREAGVRYQGHAADSALGLLIDLETAPKVVDYWVGFYNFYVITRYNRSKHYAMAVYQLGQTIQNLYGFK